MDFNAKNFSYVTRTFCDFMDDVANAKRVYLRALSSDQPVDQPANLATDFPSLAKDFRLPPELAYVGDNFFSSVLRISGPVNMWLHYDVGVFQPAFRGNPSMLTSTTRSWQMCTAKL